jgi:hypothetical protein
MSALRRVLLVVIAVAACRSPSTNAPTPGETPQFELGTQCMACHNRLTTPSGEDVSLGTTWQASMMANSARDPYWQAAVRREVMDHPTAQAAIEAECAKCHMPMAHVMSQTAGRTLGVFANTPGANGLPATADPLAVDGVSCSLCHQIGPDRLGERSSFVGGFVINSSAQRQMFGPFEVERGHVRVMSSATGAVPTTSKHIQRSELCATCHSLYTHALSPDGKVIGELAEQVPYQEWLHSAYRDQQSCQDCHMPVVTEPTPIASVNAPPRAGLSRHDFRGANFFVLGMLNRYRAELGTVAPAADLDAAVTRTRTFLRTAAATLAIHGVTRIGDRVGFEIVVDNLAGHKLPTAYPSRRAWLWVAVRDANGVVVFESGRLDPRGAIIGNDNDRDGGTFEPHHAEITTPDQVQIYESVMADAKGAVTTGLLSGVAYLKDNRVLPRGFDKRTAHADVAVHGGATDDPDFVGGTDRVRYAIRVGAAPGPFAVDAVLWYQPIGFRWAHNFKSYDAFEPRRFLAYFEAMASASATELATARATTP